MRLYLYQRTSTSNFIIRGTDSEGNAVYKSTKTTDRAIAEKKRIKLENELLEESVHGKKAVMTFDQAAVSYIEAGGDPRFLGRFDETTGKTSGLTGKLTGVKLRSINQATLDRVARELLPNVLPDTQNRQVYTPFIAVWNHAVDNEWADHRRWRRPRKPKGTRMVTRIRPKRAGSQPTSYDRAAEFVLAMSPANAVIMTILFYTGMRPIELFTMDCDQVDVKGRWITLPSSKTGEPRGVPMHRVLVPLMKALVKRGGPLVRTWKGEPWTVVEGNGGQMKKAIAQARSRTGIDDLSPYTARHTVSTQLVVNGVHQYIKDQILGHATGDDMSRNYTNVPRPDLIKAIDTLPVIQAWASAPWMTDPVGQQAKRQKPLTPAKAKMLKRYVA